jgi:Holliday junction resolvasome RuvABC endonuclease subunit
VRYIGIDSSSTNTAIVVLEDDRKLFEFTLISPVDKDLRVRGAETVSTVLSFVKRFPTQSCQVIVEAPAFMANGKVADLSMIVGGIFYGLVDKGYDCLLIPPSQHKKRFTGQGRVTKGDTILSLPESVLKSFKGTYKKLDDLADAYSLATYLLPLTSS